MDCSGGRCLVSFPKFPRWHGKYCCVYGRVRQNSYVVCHREAKPKTVKTRQQTVGHVFGAESLRFLEMGTKDQLMVKSTHRRSRKDMRDRDSDLASDGQHKESCDCRDASECVGCHMGAETKQQCECRTRSSVCGRCSEQAFSLSTVSRAMQNHLAYRVILVTARTRYNTMSLCFMRNPMAAYPLRSLTMIFRWILFRGKHRSQSRRFCGWHVQ